MKVGYLIQRLADVPEDQQWLAPPEAAILERLRIPKRRDDYLLSRWTAKATLLRFAPHESDSPLDWRIVPAASGAPKLTLKGRPAGIPISLSHSRDFGLCIAGDGATRLGCDLESVYPRSRMFEDTFFTDAEVDMLADLEGHERDRIVTLFWSAKEAALKVLQLGLRADTRRVRIRAFDRDAGEAWRALKLQDSEDGACFPGWWRDYRDMVITVLGEEPLTQPVPLSGD